MSASITSSASLGASAAAAVLGQTTRPGAAVWTGRVLSGLVTLFMLFDATIKLLQMDIVRQTGEQLGLPGHLGFGIGVMELVITVLYMIPRTAILGAILLTGVMGGAMAIHLRVGSPIFSHLLFGFYLGVMAWGGLFLRDARLRSLLLGK